VDRIDDHTLIATESYQQQNGDAVTLFWVSSDGSNWKPATLWGSVDTLFPTPLPAHEGGLLYSTMYCPPPKSFCSSLLSLYAVFKDDQLVTLDQVGAVPSVGDITQIALGPAGVMFSDGGSNMWLGARR